MMYFALYSKALHNLRTEAFIKEAKLGE